MQNMMNKAECEYLKKELEKFLLWNNLENYFDGLSNVEDTVQIYLEKNKKFNSYEPHRSKLVALTAEEISIIEIGLFLYKNQQKNAFLEARTLRKENEKAVTKIFKKFTEAKNAHNRTHDADSIHNTPVHSRCSCGKVCSSGKSSSGDRS